MHRHHLGLDCLVVASAGSSYLRTPVGPCGTGVLKGTYMLVLHEILISRILKPISQNLREDQCVFIRGYRVARAFGIFPKQIKGAAGPNPSLDEDEDEGSHDPDKELVSIPASTEVTYSC